MKLNNYLQRPNTSSNSTAYRQDHSKGIYYDPKELPPHEQTSNTSVPENNHDNSVNSANQMEFYPQLDTDENDQSDLKQVSSKQPTAHNQVSQPQPHQMKRHLQADEVKQQVAQANESRNGSQKLQAMQKNRLLYNESQQNVANGIFGNHEQYAKVGNGKISSASVTRKQPLLGYHLHSRQHQKHKAGYTEQVDQSSSLKGRDLAKGLGRPAPTTDPDQTYTDNYANKSDDRIFQSPQVEQVYRENELVQEINKHLSKLPRQAPFHEYQAAHHHSKRGYVNHYGQADSSHSAGTSGAKDQPHPRVNQAMVHQLRNQPQMLIQMPEDGQPQVEYVTDLTPTHQESLLEQQMILQNTLEGALNHFSNQGRGRLTLQQNSTEHDELGSTSNFNQLYQEQEDQEARRENHQNNPMKARTFGQQPYPGELAYHQMVDQSNISSTQRTVPMGGNHMPHGMPGAGSVQQLEQQPHYFNWGPSQQVAPSGGSTFSKKRFSMPEVHNFVNIDNHSDQVSNDRPQYVHAYKNDNLHNHHAQQHAKSSFTNLQSLAMHDHNMRAVPSNLIDRQKYDLLSQKYASLKEKTRTSVTELQRHITLLAQEKSELLFKEKEQALRLKEVEAQASHFKEFYEQEKREREKLSEALSKLITQQTKTQHLLLKQASTRFESQSYQKEGYGQFSSNQRLRNAVSSSTNQLYYNRPHPAQVQSTDHSPLFHTGHSRSGAHMANFKTENTESMDQDGEEQGAELESRNIVNSSHEEDSEDAGTVAHERESEYTTDRQRCMYTAAQSEDHAKTRSRSRKSSQNRANKPKLQSKNTVMQYKRPAKQPTDIQKYQLNASASTKPMMNMVMMQSSQDQTPMSFGAARSMPISKQHSRQPSLAKTNASSGLFGGAHNSMNQSLLTSKQTSQNQPTVAKKAPKMAGSNWSSYPCAPKAKVATEPKSSISRNEHTEQAIQGQSSFRNWLENERKLVAQQYTQQDRSNTNGVPQSAASTRMQQFQSMKNLQVKTSNKSHLAQATMKQHHYKDQQLSVHQQHKVTSKERNKNKHSFQATSTNFF